MMQRFKYLRTLLLGGFVLMAGMAMAQPEITTISTPKKKQIIFIPKLDVFWSTVIMADDFPTFFPLELEVNFPTKRLSAGLTVSPWGSSFNTQAVNTTEFTMILGLHGRYYFPSNHPSAAVGFFIEPQVFYRYYSSKTIRIGNNNEEIIQTNADMGLFLAGGYQHEFFNRLMLQGRLSVGWTNSDPNANPVFMNNYRSGNIMFLPWIGVGYKLN